MSYSLDVNVLLYASDRSSPRYETARDFVLGRADDPDVFCLAWLTVMSYLRMATHPRIFDSPLAPSEALHNVRSLLSLPRARPITEGEGFLEAYVNVTGDTPIRGNLVPDAHLATVLLQNEVRVLYTADADFHRFRFLEVRDPWRA